MSENPVSISIVQPTGIYDHEAGTMSMMVQLIEEAFGGMLTDVEKARVTSWLAEKYSLPQVSERDRSDGGVK